MRERTSRIARALSLIQSLAVLLSIETVALLSGTTPSHAQAIPQPLSALAAELLSEVRREFTSSAMDADQAAIAAGAEAMLRREGLFRWARRDVSDTAILSRFAEELGAGAITDKNRNALRQLLSADPANLVELRRAATAYLLTRSEDKPSERAIVDTMLAAVRARMHALSPLAGTYRIAGKSGFIEIEHAPDRGRLQVTIVDSTEATEPTVTVIEGRVTPEFNDDGQSRLTVDPMHEAVQPKTPAELGNWYDRVLGEWHGSDGNMYKIEGLSGASPQSDNPATEPPRESLNRQIAEKASEASALRNQKTFHWENPDTGEHVSQTKFKRLPEPFKYLGEILAAPDELARLEEEIKALEGKAATTRDTTPEVIAPAFRDTPSAQPLTIRVVHPDGYERSYTGQFSVGRVEGRTRITDVRDMKNLPIQVREQIASEWQPEQWIELTAVEIDRTGAFHLQGLWWSWNTTYDGESYKVERIHTPYSEPLLLTSFAVGKDDPLRGCWIPKTFRNCTLAWRTQWHWHRRGLGGSQRRGRRSRL